MPSPFTLQEEALGHLRIPGKPLLPSGSPAAGLEDPTTPESPHPRTPGTALGGRRGRAGNAAGNATAPSHPAKGSVASSLTHRVEQ